MKGQNQLTGINNKTLISKADNTYISAHTAVQNYDLDSLKFIVNQDPEVIYKKNSTGKTPLQIAFESNQKDTINYMLGKINYSNIPLGFNPNIFANKDGYFPLNLAIDIKDIKMVQHLLSLGASVDATDNLDRTALMFAAMLGDAEIVRILLAAGADPEKVDIDGSNPLEIVVQYGRFGILKTLVQNGSKVDIQKPNLKKFLVDDFDFDNYISQMNLEKGTEPFNTLKDDFLRIQRLLLAANYIQRALDDKLTPDEHLKPFYISLETAEVLKNMIFCELKDSANFTEVQKKYANLLKNKDRFAEAFDNDSENKLSSKTNLDEVIKDTLEPLFGGNESAQSLIPKLKLLALSQIPNFKTAFKEIGSAFEDLYKLGADYKVLSGEQLASAQTALEDIAQENQNLLGEEATQEVT